MTDTPNHLEESARQWVREVNAAYSDGGYASGDGPNAPLDEMEWLIDQLDTYREALRQSEDGCDVDSCGDPAPYASKVRFGDDQPWLVVQLCERHFDDL